MLLLLLVGLAQIGLGRESFEAAAQGMLVLARAEGDLEVVDEATTETHEVYFHIPIATEHQAPIFFKLTSPELVSYRYLREDEDNVHMVATLRSAPPEVELDWQSFVLMSNRSFADRPLDVPLPVRGELPEESLKWLSETACVQLDDPYVEDEAAAVRAGAENLDELAEAITTRVAISDDHFFPRSYDAYYGLQHGGSCTSHAHAAAALFRANGVPARGLGVIMSGGGRMDMHWVVDYMIPDYGWVMLESTTGNHPISSMSEVVTFISRPADEFPLHYVNGIDVHFHGSDPFMNGHNPQWGLAHSSQWLGYMQGSREPFDALVALGREVFEAEVEITGMRLTPAQQEHFDAAREAQQAAVEAVLAEDLAAARHELLAARHHYRAVAPRHRIVVLDEDFEADDGGWTHGGPGDEWEWGSPAAASITAHSGARCWATDLDDTYENDSDSWLVSPPVDLGGLAGATLDFWLLNWVEEDSHAEKVDYLWLDISTDGERFVPLSSKMGGVTDNPTVPAVAGWSHVVLDLSKYAEVEGLFIRFRFSSDAATTQPGSYIDDVRVSGRPLGSASEPRRSAGRVVP